IVADICLFPAAFLPSALSFFHFMIGLLLVMEIGPVFIATPPRGRSYTTGGGRGWSPGHAPARRSTPPLVRSPSRNRHAGPTRTCAGRRTIGRRLGVTRGLSGARAACRAREYAARRQRSRRTLPGPAHPCTGRDPGSQD